MFHFTRNISLGVVSSQMTEFVCSRPRGYKALSTCRDTWVSRCARETTVGLIVLYKMIFSHIIIIMQRS